MSVSIRSYREEGVHYGDRRKVSDFLVHINHEKMAAPHYLWGR